MLPLGQSKVEQEAEKRRLRRYLDRSKRTMLGSKIKKTLAIEPTNA
jgi:hypothetical protein